MLVNLLLAAAIATAPVQLSPQARAAIAPVFDAIAKERAAQAALEPAKDDSERLVRLGRLDQAPRLALAQVDFSQAPADERDAAHAAVSQAIAEVDAANRSAMYKLLPANGWFGTSGYGEDASNAAFEILQHSDSSEWRRFLPVIERFVAIGEASGPGYAGLYDSLAVADGRLQRYGTQLHCQASRMTPYPVEDPGGVDEHRRSVGISEPYAVFLAAEQKDAC